MTNRIREQQKYKNTVTKMKIRIAGRRSTSGRMNELDRERVLGLS